MSDLAPHVSSNHIILTSHACWISFREAYMDVGVVPSISDVKGMLGRQNNEVKRTS